MPKVAKEVPLSIPAPISNVDEWIILGLDPSMTRTGFAVLDVAPSYGSVLTAAVAPTKAGWLAAGSIKPEKIDDPAMHPRNTLWIRGKAMALELREHLLELIRQRFQQDRDTNLGLIISMEYPTPMNDYLVALNRIIHLIFFENASLPGMFREIRIMTTNASTLRSLMRLTKKGSQNKGENIARAYEFIDRTEFPELDSDACDAVLLAMMGRHAASIMLGRSTEVPNQFLISLCNATKETKGKGRNAHEVTKGLLHRNEYYYRYERKEYTVCVKDAKNPKKLLTRVTVSI
jgi:hypothetical protein